jgi:hypothetical protein
MNIFQNGATKKIQYVSIGLMLIIYAAVFTLMLWPLNPVEFHGTKILTPIVKQGGALKYRLYFTKNNDIIPTVQRFLYNTKTREREAVSLSFGEAKEGEVDKPIRLIVPKSAEPGKYRILVLVTYEYFGGLRKVQARYWSEPFEVVE